MEKTLNTANIRHAMEQAGLSPSSLSKELEVSREAVSKWLSGAKYPRPDKLLRLANLLELNLKDLVNREVDPNEPVVAFRKKGSAKTTDKHIIRAKNIGKLLACLVPYLPFDEFVQPSKLKTPKLDYDYVQTIASRIRDELGLRIDQVIDFTNLIHIFHELHAVIIPVMWGRKQVHENALHIYLPESMSTWIYLNLDTEVHDFKFWMAHELGHVFSPDLSGDKAEDFADAFAGALLFPGERAEEAYKEVIRTNNDELRLTAIKEYALESSISMVSVYMEMNKYATHAGQPEIKLGNNLYKSNTNLNKNFHIVSDSLFEGRTPDAREYIHLTTDTFESPFFEALKKYLAEHGKSAGFIQSVLDTPLIDAKELYAELS